MKKLNFKRVTKFYLYGEQYEMFKTNYEQIAFLKVLDNGEYDYPSYREFALLARKYADNLTTNKPLLMDDDDKFKFVPLIKENVKNKIRYIMITSALVFSTVVASARTFGVNALSFDEVYKPEQTIETEAEVTTENIQVADEISLEELEKELDTSISNEEAIDDVIEKSDQIKLIEYMKAHQAKNVIGQTDYDLYDKDTTPLDHEFMYFPSENSYTILDTDMTYAAFETRDYTKEEVISIIKNNKNLDDKFKKFAIRFVETMDEYYDGLDYHLFAKNMEKLRTKTMPKEKLKKEKGYVATFDSKKGLITYPEEIDYSDPYYEILLNHELGHMFNNYAETVIYTNQKGKTESVILYYTSYYYGHGIYLSEAANTLFTSKPFYDDYTEKRRQNFGYSLISNEYEIMIESAGYNLKNCVNDNIYEMEDYLEKHDNSDINMNHLIDLLESQWNDFKDPDYQLDSSSIDVISNYIYNEYKQTVGYDNLSNEEKDYYDQLFQFQILKGTTQGYPNFNFDVTKQLKK